MINWSNVLGSKNGQRLVEEFAQGRINRDNMIVRVPELREVIRSKGVNAVRNMSKKALKRRQINV